MMRAPLRRVILASINRLTSLPDSVLSKCRRSRHAEFQHIKRRHQREP